MDPDELFATFPRNVIETCWRLHDLVLDAVPHADARVRVGWRLVGFETEQYFCAVAPQKDHARVLFERGTELEDPDGKLQGSGTQVRWLGWKNADDVDAELVTHFVLLAAELAKTPLKQTKPPGLPKRVVERTEPPPRTRRPQDR